MYFACDKPQIRPVCVLNVYFLRLVKLKSQFMKCNAMIVHATMTESEASVVNTAQL